MHIFVLLLGKGLKKGLCHGCLVHVVHDVKYCSLKPLSILSLGKILQQISEITPTYWLVSYLLADNWLICGLRAHYAWFLRAMSSWLRATVYLSLFISKQCIIVKQSLDSIFVISGIIKVPVIVISLGLELGGWHLPRPWLFRISQKPYPIIVYYASLFAVEELEKAVNDNINVRGFV